MPSQNIVRTGVYPGTFDPITRGHLNLIKRATRLVDRLVVAVAENPGKSPVFTYEERFQMVKNDIREIKQELKTGNNGHCEIEVMPFDCLLVEFARKQNAICVFRGLRAVSDFDYEFKMAGMNLHIAPEIETIFLMATDKWQFVSSSFIKEVYSLGGDIGNFVTPSTLQALEKKYKRTK